MNLAEDIVSKVDKEFGKRFTTQRVSGLPDCGVAEWVSTGSMFINNVIHRPGIPVGRLTTIWGQSATGKTTLITHILCSVQQQGGLAILMDTEHSYDPERAARIGMVNDDVLLYQSLCLEDAFGVIHRICDVSIANGAPQLIVVALDSHSGTPTKAEVDADLDASKGEIASSSRVTSFNLKRLIGSGMLTKARVTLVFACQPKCDISRQFGFGPPPETYIAKRPIDYHSTLILQLMSMKKLSTGDGISVKVRCRKNKAGPPYGECRIDIMNSDGIQESGSLLELAIEVGTVVVKGGGWYLYGSRKFQRKDWSNLIAEYPSILEELKSDIGSTK